MYKVLVSKNSIDPRVMFTVFYQAPNYEDARYMADINMKQYTYVRILGPSTDELYIDGMRVTES